MRLLIINYSEMFWYCDKLLIVTLLPFPNSVTLSDYHCIHIKVKIWTFTSCNPDMTILSHSLTVAFITLKASRQMHNDMLNRVLRSPMSFFDTTPVGRIVNRCGIGINWELIGNQFSVLKNWFHGLKLWKRIHSPFPGIGIYLALDRTHSRCQAKRLVIGCVNPASGRLNTFHAT